jgi:uncharacterized membrane protein (UPF0127 family)
MGSTFFQRLIGLMFRRSIDPGGGLLSVGHNESISSASIHMQFCFMELGIVWAARDKRVVNPLFLINPALTCQDKFTISSRKRKAALTAALADPLCNIII